MLKLDFKTCTKKDIKTAINNLAHNKLDYLEIKNIYPAYFEEKFDMETDDFNGYDFWGHIVVDNKEIPVFGEAWYGLIEVGDPDKRVVDNNKPTTTIKEEPKKEYIIKKSDLTNEEAMDRVWKDYTKIYFWHDNSDKCRYTAVYTEDANLAYRAMIDLWGSYQDSVNSTEKLKELEQHYRERWPSCLPRTTFSGDAYVILRNPDYTE